MDFNYNKLFEKVKFGNQQECASRVAMSPMLVFASNADGSVSEDDLKFFERRNDTGSLIITGSAAISLEGTAVQNQLSVSDDDKLEGLTKLAKVIKSKGNKAIMQLFHGGRESYACYAATGRVLAPSAIKFPFLDYTPDEMTNEDILRTIDDFAAAALRAYKAGFDGVEIHGGNHYLLQQFFSVYSNTREDDWGGTLEKRMAFAIAIVNKVKKVLADAKADKFIVGYRISPEEVHGENVGYVVDDALVLIDSLIEAGIDYLHISSNDYRAYPKKGGFDEPIAKTVHKSIKGRIPLILAGSILSPQEALDALNYTDMVALARAVIIDPDFVVKIREGRADEVETSVEGRLDKLSLSNMLLGVWQSENSPLPPLKGLHY